MQNQSLEQIKKIVELWLECKEDEVGPGIPPTGFSQETFFAVQYAIGTQKGFWEPTRLGMIKIEKAITELETINSATKKTIAEALHDLDKYSFDEHIFAKIMWEMWRTRDEIHQTKEIYYMSPTGDYSWEQYQSEFNKEIDFGSNQESDMEDFALEWQNLEESLDFLFRNKFSFSYYLEDVTEESEYICLELQKNGITAYKVAAKNLEKEYLTHFHGRVETELEAFEWALENFEVSAILVFFLKSESLR